jgi:hypothetical protein
VTTSGRMGRIVLRSGGGMPPWLTEAMKLVGFTTPFVYAAITYAFFAFLDRNASGAAKDAISTWLKRSPIALQRVGEAILELFSRVYGRHLFTVNTAVRSAFISMTILALFYFTRAVMGREDHNPVEHRDWTASVGRVVFFFSAGILGNTLSDYLSLYVVRRCIERFSGRPFLLLLAATVFGTLFVALAWTCLYALLLLAYVAFQKPIVLVPWRAIPLFADLLSHISTASWWRPNSFLWFFYPPAVFVHFWFVLVAAAALLLRISDWALAAVGWAQWFLKRGRYHPLKALGYVAAALVFVGTATIQALLR